MVTNKCRIQMPNGVECGEDHQEWQCPHALSEAEREISVGFDNPNSTFIKMNVNPERAFISALGHIMELQKELEAAHEALNSKARDHVEMGDALRNVVEELQSVMEKHTVLQDRMKKLERYKRRTEGWKRCLFHILGCETIRRVLEEVSRIKAHEYDEDLRVE